MDVPRISLTVPCSRSLRAGNSMNSNREHILAVKYLLANQIKPLAIFIPMVGFRLT